MVKFKGYREDWAPFSSAQYKPVNLQAGFSPDLEIKNKNPQKY